uniref:Formin-like protein 1 isoform X2 n=1 Tax=Sus scrofa TaxID=9823 RepID=A0A480P6Z1_PIG
MGTGVKPKKPIQTKFRMPLLNWVALKPNQITGTVFTEINDEKVLRELDMSDFEEQFKTKSQGPSLDLTALKSKAAQKAPSKATLIEANRAKNLAITLRKGNLGADRICQAIETYDLQALGLDFLELLTRFLPTEYERSLITRFEQEQRPIEELSEEDRFMLRFSRIPRLPERMNTLIFLGNFPDTAQLLMPQLNAVIAASMSIKSSDRLRQILEIVLAFGNYMNSSKRGAAYGFRLQSLDALLEMKSTDRKQTLLHYLVKVIAEKYPQLTGFHSDLHFLDKAGSVSLDSVLGDVRSLQRGLELTQREFVRQDDCVVLKEFLRANSPTMDKLLADSKTAQEAYESVVEYFGENPKTTSPSMFFSLFSRFIKAYKKAEQEVEQWKKEAAAQEAGTDTAGRGEPSAPKSPPKVRRQQMDLISELKRKQQKEPLIYESDRDGAIEDIITGEGLVGPVLSCPRSVLCCPPPTPPALGVWLPHCFFATFLSFFPFSLSLPLLPSNPQCSRRCPSRLALARGRPGSSVRPAWERRSPSSPQICGTSPTSAQIQAVAAVVGAPRDRRYRSPLTSRCSHCFCRWTL